MTNTIRLVLFDIDDTLVRKHDGYLPDSVPKALRELRKRGIITGIATGRSASILPEKILSLILETNIRLIATSNGQYTVYDTQIIGDHPLPPKDVNTIVNYARTQNWAYLLHGADALKISANISVVPETMHSIERWDIDPKYHEKVPIYQIGLFVNEAQTAQLMAENLPLTERYSPHRWGQYGIDLLPASGTKARAITDVCAFFDLVPAQVAVFGDGDNDIEMFQAVDFSIAMGNAKEELKAHAYFVTRDLAEDGIVTGLQYLGLI